GGPGSWRSGGVPGPPSSVAASVYQRGEWPDRRRRLPRPAPVAGAVEAAEGPVVGDGPAVLVDVGPGRAVGCVTVHQPGRLLVLQPAGEPFLRPPKDTPGRQDVVEVGLAAGGEKVACGGIDVVATRAQARVGVRVRVLGQGAVGQPQQE